MARIFIVDDHHYFRVHLRNLLESVEEWEICGEAENGKEAVEKHSTVQPHITVMDFNMPELNGLDASRAILRKCPDAPILLLTVFTSTELASQAVSSYRSFARTALNLAVDRSTIKNDDGPPPNGVMFGHHPANTLYPSRRLRPVISPP